MPLRRLNSSRALFTASWGRASLQIRSLPLFQQYSFFGVASAVRFCAWAGNSGTASSRPTTVNVANLDMVKAPCSQRVGRLP